MSKKLYKILKNKKIPILGLLLVIILLSSFLIIKSSKESEKLAKKVFRPIPKEAEFAPEQLVVQFFDPYIKGKDKNLDEKLEKIGVTSVEKLYNTSKDPVLQRFYIVHFKKETDVRNIHKVFFDFNEVESVDPNFKMKALAVPNDPYYSQMWGLKKIGAEEAWDITKGSTSIIVAVTDTGIDYNHPDLPKDNIIKGKDFVNGDDDPMDDHGHGTHVSGTIGAVTNNGTGVAGINWNVKIMAIKVLSGQGSGYDSWAAQGIQYAADNGARVVNMSLGGYSPCPSSYQSAIDYAKSKGTLVVVAAGNGNPPGYPVDASTNSPANCKGVLAVGATKSDDTRASFSNYGPIVSISAPGFDILSTIPGGNYQQMSGTSMATPHVAGAAGLLLSAKPDLTPDQVKDCLVNNADPISTDLPVGPRLNIYKAITACAGGGPPPSSSPTPSGSTTPTPSINPSGTPRVTPSITPTPVPIGKFMIHGHVYNRIRTGVPGKTILFHETVSFPGLSGSEVSDSDGYYEMPELDGGTYKLSLILTNKTFEYPNKKVALNNTNPIAVVNFIIGDPDSPPDIEIINAPVVTSGVKLPTPKAVSNPSPTKYKPGVVTPTYIKGKKPTSSPVPYKCEPDPTCVKNSNGLKICPLKCTPI
ncbi:MAG: S8 family peptidase [Patescibacteria group bacterium]|nr:S8 family peptidase [Patescibacteria group bacterium]